MSFVRGIEGIGGELFEGVIQVFVAGGNTLLGVGASLCTTASFGQWDYMKQHSAKALDSARILQIPFRVLTDFQRWDLHKRDWTFSATEGYFTSRVAHRLYDGAVSCANSSDRGFGGMINRQVVSRIGFLLFPIVSAITRTADLIFGLMAAFFALLMWGTDNNLNKTAEANLSFFALISDVCIAARGVFYPQQFS